MTRVAVFARADQFEQRLCRVANSAARRHAVRAVFGSVSRLGDGVFWYLLIASMPILSPGRGTGAAIQMLLAGSCGLAMYKYMKVWFVRERPFIGLVGIECVMPPLDRYSFPSGHTLHAVCFTTIAVTHVPAVGWVLVPFTMLVAASRVILGLHYPSDVLVGALIGAAIGGTATSLLPI